MTINDVMIREIAEAEAERKAAEASKPVEGEVLTGWACTLAWVLGVGLGVFLGWCVVSGVPHVFPSLG